MQRPVYSFLFAFTLFGLACDSTEPAPDELLAIVSSPERSAAHNAVYSYRIVTDETSQNSSTTTIEIQEKPDWLLYDENQRLLSGMPGAEGLGSHAVRIRLSNGEVGVTQAYTIEVTRGDLIYDGSWNTAFGVNYGHDGLTYESDNFIIYSDFSRVSAREQLAELFEEAFAELMQRLDVTKTDFKYLPGQNKIEIYADYDQTNNIGLAYRDGIIMRALDSPGFSGFGHTIESYKRLIRHELMHVFEFMLIGTVQFRQASDVWFREGFASYMGGPFPSSITTVQQVDDWQSRYAGTAHLGNPIRVHVWSDFPADVLANRTTIEFYPFFELALYYLLSPGGGNATLQDVVTVYDEMGMGTPFAEALETHIGVNLVEFEADYFASVKAYLASS